MSAISGVVNTKTEISDKFICSKMTEICYKNKKKEKINSYLSKNLCFSSASKELLPVFMNFGDNKYVVVYDGEIYNSDEIKNYIKEKYNLSGTEKDAELILILYHLYGNKFIEKINGVFAIAIWNENNKELILARDRFGIKPLFYSVCNNTLIFSSEIKGILASGYVKPELTKDGLCHIFGIGPALEQGNAVFKDIYEVLPAEYLIYNIYGLKHNKYWDIKSVIHTDSFDDTSEKVYNLAKKAILRQINKNNGKVCCFLSGGLDSSIITGIAAQYSEKTINTYSVDYSGNKDFFIPNEYQPESDMKYINLMSESFGTNHQVVEITQEDLVKHLKDALYARDIPGMGDIDSSLYCFCQNVGLNYDNAMSGECADEVFGGYPWFHRKDDLESGTFPWTKNTDLRCDIINKAIIMPCELKEYIDTRYRNSINNTPELYKDSVKEKRIREISYLNINWFMYSLGARSERIGRKCGLNIRMPFCDYELFEYVWNIPWDFKAYTGREKGLLRHCFSKDLPDEIVYRKKSPYPKTHNPIFEELVKEELNGILSCDRRKIFEIINKEYILDLMKEDSDYSKPWFGQLMALPQLYAYLIQLDSWLEDYNIVIKI